MNWAWENITENSRTSTTESLGLYELKQHKPCFDEGSLRFFDQRTQAKLQWLQHPNHSNVDNLSDVRREARRHIRNKKKDNLKSKIDALETNSPTYSMEQSPSCEANGF